MLAARRLDLRLVTTGLGWNAQAANDLRLQPLCSIGPESLRTVKKVSDRCLPLSQHTLIRKAFLIPVGGGRKLEI